MIGPPLIISLITKGLLTIQQEIEAGILMPTDFIEKPISKNRKMKPSMELTMGKP
jgi:hypothetical protein